MSEPTRPEQNAAARSPFPEAYARVAQGACRASRVETRELALGAITIRAASKRRKIAKSRKRTVENENSSA